MTKLLDKIQSGDFLSAIKEIIEDPAKITTVRYAERPNREGVMHYAVDSCNIDFLEFIIVNGGIIDDAPSDRGYMTPLTQACHNGDINVIKILLKHGARIDGVDASISSPLMEAAREAKPEIVKFLLDAGADVSRLGFYQRYFPLDFAGWFNSEKCKSLIIEAGGISVAEDFNWKAEPGWPIVVTVSNLIGAVYPMQLATKENPTSIRVAQIRDKPKPMYIFTDVLHQKTIPRIELSFVLGPRWGILAEYKDGLSQQSFPVDVLRILDQELTEKRIQINEGSIFKKSDPLLHHLKWPDGIDTLVAINHHIGAPEDIPIDKSDRIDILVLAPLTEGGTWSKGKKQMENAITKLKTAKWKKIMLADPLFPDD